MNHVQRKSLGLGVVVCALVVSLAACSSGSSKSAGSSTPGTAAGDSHSTAAPSGSAAVPATCKQLTIAEIQPLIVDKITKVTVKEVTAGRYTGGTESAGQRCTFASASTSIAIDVLVVGGPSAQRAYESDLASFGSGPIAVPGVGDKAWRAEVDANGSAATTQLLSIKGSTYCTVNPGDGEIPGIAQLDHAAGDSARIGDKAYKEVAAAVGTICNRIFGSGNTTPDLTELIAAGSAASTAVTTTTELSLGPLSGDGPTTTN